MPCASRPHQGGRCDSSDCSALADSGGVDAFGNLRYLLATLDARAATSHSRIQALRSET